MEIIKSYWVCIDPGEWTCLHKLADRYILVYGPHCSRITKEDAEALIYDANKHHCNDHEVDEEYSLEQLW